MTNKAHTPDETLAAWAGQDVRARERLFRRHLGPVTHYLMQQFTGIEHEAIASEAVLTTLDYVGRHRLKKSFVTLLYRVAVQQAWKARRRVQTRDHHEVALAECPEHTARLRQAGPEDRVIAEITLNEALDRLTSQERETLLLRYVDELSEAEIVARQGRTLHAVKSSLYHARQKLRADPNLRPTDAMGPHTKNTERNKDRKRDNRQAMPEQNALNLNFEAGAKVTGWPKHWGGGGEGYALTVDKESPHSGHSCGRVEYVGPVSSSGFGTLTQYIPARQYLDKRVRYAGWLKTRDVEEWGGLWMRVDGFNNDVLAFDNMKPRGVTGTADWMRYEVVLDVPPEATQICFGLLLSGGGTLWGDDLSIEIVDAAGQGSETTGFPAFMPTRVAPTLDAAWVVEQIGVMQVEINALKVTVTLLESAIENRSQ